MIIDFNDETNKLLDSQFQQLEQLIVFTLEKENMPTHCEVSVSIVTDEQIKQLNAEYRQIDEPTDVLSFPIEESLKDKEFVENQDQPLLLGDIIISIDHVYEQAERFNHSFKRELSFLIVHGLLHLLGYTHDTDEEEKEMFTKQDEILGAFNIERE